MLCFYAWGDVWVSLSTQQATLQRTNATPLLFVWTAMDLSPAWVSMQGASSSVSWGLYGDDQGHAVQTELLVRVSRWVKPGSGAKTGLRHPCSDLDKLYPPSFILWICTATQMRCVVQPTIHTNSLWVWWSFLPYHAPKLPSTEKSGHARSAKFLLSCLWRSSPSVPWGWGYQHGLHHQCRGPDSLLGDSWFTPLSHWGYRDLGQAGCRPKTLQQGEINSDNLYLKQADTGTC